MKKKLLMYFLMLMLAFSFTACSGDDDSSSKRSERDKDDEDEDDEDKDDKKDKDQEESKDDEDEKYVDEDEKSEDEDDTQKDDENNEVVDDNEDKDDSSSTSTSGLSDNILDYQVSIDGVVYQVPMWFSDFEALGWEYAGDSERLLASDSYAYDCWTKDGIEIWTDVTNFSINSTAVKDCLVTGIEIDEYYLPEDIECVFANGIKILESTQDDIIAAYGEPTDIFEGSYTYLTYSEDYYSYGNEVEFMLDNDVLISVSIANEVELDGFDNTFYDETPSFIADYVAPTEIGSDLFDTEFKLEGEYYSLPCPVQVFLDNGFEFGYYYTEEDFVRAGAIIYCDLELGDRKFDVTVKNFSDYATAKENCYVIGINDFANDGSDWDLEVPGGLKMGSTEEELIAFIGENDHYFYEGSDSNDYNIYESVWEYTNSRSFSAKEGLIEHISMFCDKHPEFEE